MILPKSWSRSWSSSCVKNVLGVGAGVGVGKFKVLRVGVVVGVDDKVNRLRSSEFKY